MCIKFLDMFWKYKMNINLHCIWLQVYKCTWKNINYNLNITCYGFVMSVAF